MNRLVLVIVIAGAFFLFQHFQEQKLATARQAYQRGLSAQTDNCSGKKFCAVIYVAPWCPACKQMKPQFLRALKRSETKTGFGVRVVVGQGTSEQNEKEAASFGFGAVTDPDASVLKSLGVRAFPSFFVIDEEKTVILSGREAFDWINEKLN